MSFIDPDQREAWAKQAEQRRKVEEAMKKAQAEQRCFSPSHGADYRTFRLTEADAALLRAVSEGVGIRDGWIVPRRCDAGAAYRSIVAAWAVIGERHGFDPATATEHPEGGAQVLAKPPAKAGPVTRGA